MTTISKPHDGVGRWWRDMQHALRRWRREAKSHLPYVRRREFVKLGRKYDALVDGVGLSTRRACEALIHAPKPVDAHLRGNVALFLCHHPGPELKPHALRHIEQLLMRGVQVILILNADDVSARVDIDPSLVARLSGIYVRENVGFDFAGWAHVHALLRERLQVSRLFLINDSIVGPIDAQSFDDMMRRIRMSASDMVGLTEALTPVPHLQSYFLVFQRRLADGEELRRFFDGVMCFADKGTVIDVYETRLTQRMRDAGYRCEALFPAMSDDPHASNDTFFRWDELLDNGFPYVKTSVLKELGEDTTEPGLVLARPRVAASRRQRSDAGDAIPGELRMTTGLGRSAGKPDRPSERW